MPMHFCGKMTAGLFPLLFLFIARVLIAQETNGKPLAGGAVITNMAQFWELPSEEKDQLHRIRMELLIYYCDSKWTVFWGQSDGLDTFLPLRGIPVPLRAGQKVLIDGFSLPVNQEVLWDKTTVKILSESNELKSVSAKGRLFDTSTLDKHFVELEALVDSQRLISTNILRLDLLAQNFNFTANVLMDQPETNPPDFSGNFVRIDGVYSATFDALGKIASITLWTDGLHFVVTNGSLGSDSRFTLPITSSENFATFDPNALAHVQGIVRSQQPGQAVTIWDNAGQIRIYSKQEYPLQVGERIEAVGYPAFQGIDRVLQGGLFRLTAGKEVGPKEISDGHSKLRLADQVRGLDQETIAQRLPVSLEGVVTWVDPRRNFIFILDSSGGIRVMRPQNPDGRRLRAGMLVKVNGVTAMGEFTPAITNATVRQTGTMSLPDPPLVSLEEAMTGTEDGRWIQMRGYVRKSSEETNSIRLQLVAPGGEFIARIPKDNTLRTLNGSVVLVRGVCVVTANARRQLTGIQIWSPEVSDVQIEQSAPADVFALPLRTLASLRQFNLFNTLNERVRTRGTVTLQVPGRYLYVQDADNSVQALCDQNDPLRPGDSVEVVGFPGTESGNFLLREASYRRVGSGPEPTPVQLPVQQSLDEDLDGLLVCAEGVLLDTVEKSGETHLMVQAKGSIFEAKLDKPGKFSGKNPELGSKLALTGVYRIQRDESGELRSFLLNLRDGGDIRVLEPPPWWTLRRLLLALAGVVVISLVALLWALETRHKNNLLQHTQVELKAAHDKLEERVRERTCNLQEANEALRRSEERFVKAFRASPVPLLLQSAGDERYVDVNESFLQLTGFKREEVLGQTPAGLKLFVQPAVGREICEAFSAKRQLRNMQAELCTREGKMLTVLISAEAFELEGQSHVLVSL